MSRSHNPLDPLSGLNLERDPVIAVEWLGKTLSDWTFIIDLFVKGPIESHYNENMEVWASNQKVLAEEI